MAELPDFKGLQRGELWALEKQNNDNILVLQHILAECERRSVKRPVRYRRHVDRLKGRIQEVQAEWFRWYSTLADAPGSNALPFLPYDLGMLRFLGYRVGKTGRTEADRRALLHELFASDLPALNDAEYMAGWGAPRTAQRLKKMAYSIWALANTRSRRVDAGSDLAIEHWALDLDYLYDRYYVAHFGFDWPRLEVGSRR